MDAGIQNDHDYRAGVVRGDSQCVWAMRAPQHNNTVSNIEKLGVCVPEAREVLACLDHSSCYNVGCDMDCSVLLR